MYSYIPNNRINHLPNRNFPPSIKAGAPMSLICCSDDRLSPARSVTQPEIRFINDSSRPGSITDIYQPSS